MVAAINDEVAAWGGELAFLDVFDPGAVDANGNIMFRLTRDGAGMTTNALALVDNEGIFGHEYFSFSPLNKDTLLLIIV